MGAATILLADNKKENLQSWSEVLRDAGFDVKKASSVASAEKALKQGGLDLAILDLRLERDDDPNDDSGRRLAEAYRGTVPIIILCSEANKRALLWAVQGDREGAGFVSVVEKNQGPEALLNEVRRAIPPKVFVSHGHDEGATSAVVSFLESGGARAVVLRDETRASQALLDEFERHAKVEFAVVLVTPDDVGAREGETLRPRARQNVIFELGFFLAKLGRNRVVALCKEEGEPIELPSNYQGVLYREMKGDWKIDLTKDLTAAGVDFRLNLGPARRRRATG